MAPSFSVDRRALAAWVLFGLLSLVFFWQPLLTGGVLIPTSPRIYEPWSTADEVSYVSNDLMSDTLILTYPWRLYSHRVLRDGEIPFWNPYIFSGYPHLAALQSNVLYPPVLFFDLWHPVAGIAYAMALHLALAGGLMFCFLRRLGLGYAAATFGGVVFELNGFFMVRMSAPSYVFSGIWTPLLLIGIRDLIGGAGWRASWKVVLPTCMALLGGHPQIFVLSMLIGGAYGLFIAWPQLLVANSRRRVITGLFGTGIAIGLGVGLASVQLLPFLELVRESERSPAAFDDYRSLALPIAALAQGALPDVFGHPVDKTYNLEALRPPLQESTTPLWRWNYCGENLFTGITPLLFAIFALLQSRQREGLFFGFLFAGALLLLLGSPPVLWFFYEWIPTFQFSRADRITYVYMFAVCVLAGMGYSRATVKSRPQAEDSPGQFTFWLSRLLLILPFLPAIFAFVASSTARASFHRAVDLIREAAGLSGQLIEAAAITAGSLGLLQLLSRQHQFRGFLVAGAVLLAAIPLIRFGWHFNPVQPAPFLPASPVISRIESNVGEFGRIAHFRTSALRPNLAQVFGFFDVNGASAATLARYTRVIQALDSRAVLRQKSIKTFYDETIFESPLLDFLGVQVVIANQHPLQLPKVPNDAPNSTISLYRNPSALPRFFLVDQIETYRDVVLAIERLNSPEFDPAALALVEDEAQVTLTEPNNTADEVSAPDAAVEVLAYEAHNIELQVVTSGDRLLVSSEVDYPGWEVDIDGRRAKKVLVNTAFRGVVVEAGEHTVRFHFVPRSFYVGLLLSLLSLVLLIASLRWPAWFDRLAVSAGPS